MNNKRVRQLNSYNYKSGKIIYWMSREQRVDENWSLIYAQQLAIENNVELVVVFNLVPEFLGATLRHYDFMIKGLEQIESKLNELNIRFEILIGNPVNNILDYVVDENIGILITDFDPLKIKKIWQNQILEKINIPFYIVDSHNIVPVWEASNKQEFGAYTIRPKINKQLNEFLDEFPKLIKQDSRLNKNLNKNNWDMIWKSIKVDSNFKPVEWLKSGENEAKEVLKFFIDNKLNSYKELRNNPEFDNQSNLSPYIHFGQISAQYIAKEVINSKKNEEAIEDFLEELIVRRELADNFCYYNDNYDNFDGLPNWAQETLKKHENDIREYNYNLDEFENANTHDKLWNAAQNELLSKGKIHGFVRMYWAKKILEWTKNPKEAIKIAIYLNDKYSIDGRDPNGYVGILWSIGGLHDRAWFEREIYGKIRYMNYNGCKRKFNVEKYIEKVGSN